MPDSISTPQGAYSLAAMPDSISTPQGAYSLAALLTHTTDQLTMQSLHHFLLLWYEGPMEMDLLKALTMIDSAKIQSHDLLIIGSVPKPTLPQFL